jgi:hypothetical protein
MDAVPLARPILPGRNRTDSSLNLKRQMTVGIVKGLAKCQKIYHDIWTLGIQIRKDQMKIKVEGEKIIKAVKKLDGIEIVLENLEDAKEAINLILLRTGLFDKHKDAELKDVKVTSFQKYETTAVDYKMIFLLEFLFEDGVALDIKVSVLKELQGFFNKV